MTNDQRMVDVGLLEYALRVIELSTPDYEDWRTQADKLRAIIDGPGVEPVAYLYKVLTIGKGLSTEFAAIEYHLQDGEKLIWKKPLYLAAPSAPVPSDEQGPFSKARLKRLVTQVFGDGYQIVPQSAPVQAVPKEPPPGLLMSMAIRFDHGLAIPGYYDSIPLYEGCTHEQRLKSTLTQMRQLYEEVSGNGFYRPEKEAEYAMLAAAPQPPKAGHCQECGVLLSVYKHRSNCKTRFNVDPQPPKESTAQPVEFSPIVNDPSGRN